MTGFVVGAIIFCVGVIVWAFWPANSTLPVESSDAAVENDQTSQAENGCETNQNG